MQGQELGQTILGKLYASITTLVCVGRKLKMNAVQRKFLSSLGLGRAAGVKTQPEH